MTNDRTNDTTGGLQISCGLIRSGGTAADWLTLSQTSANIHSGNGQFHPICTHTRILCMRVLPSSSWHRRVTRCRPEHNGWTRLTDRGISNSSTMAGSLHNHPCYCLCWFIERQRPLVPPSPPPRPAPDACIVFHFGATYCHGKTPRPWAGVPVACWRCRPRLIKRSRWVTRHLLCGGVQLVWMLTE